ncbi:hypothetical protein THRCLA_03989 [Thraustotheca clavata]|uniref:Uncharacterized protein n=1 Tax=Thraustotheca clavata TaxID=74557 RepID=A0A1W0A0A6_9STRA|nr:hypothetical protein THRCLA_03989 [Thraustotheca clavata]
MTELHALYMKASKSSSTEETIYAFADACVVAVNEGAKEKAQKRRDLTSLIEPVDRFKGKNTENKLVLLQLQVICRISLQAIAKTDPWTKKQKKELESLLSLLAMTMDAVSMQESIHEQVHLEHSAFAWFILDTIKTRFDTFVPKTLKRLIKDLEINTESAKSPPSVLKLPPQLPKEPMTRQTSNDMVIAEVLSQETSTTATVINPTPIQKMSSFKEIVLPTIKPRIKQATLIPRVVPPVEEKQNFDSPRKAKKVATPVAKQPMVMKTPERPQRPATKKRLVLVASSPPLRRPVKRNISALSLLKKP